MKNVHPNSMKDLELNGCDVNENGLVQVRFKPGTNGFVCPKDCHHSSNNMLVIIDAEKQKIKYLHCFGSHENESGRIELFCQKCQKHHRGLCEPSDLYNVKEDFYKSFLEKIPKAETKKFGGEIGEKNYHSKKLTEHVASVSANCIEKKVQYVYLNTSDMGTGKTTQIATLVRHWRNVIGANCTISVLTSRCALGTQLHEDLNKQTLPFLKDCGGPQKTNHLKGPVIEPINVDLESVLDKPFPAALYMDISKDENLYDHKLVICQAESLHRLRKSDGNIIHPDVVIIDEASSHLKQLRSDKTFVSNEERLLIRNQHIEMCKHAKVVVLACADMTAIERDHYLKYYVKEDACVEEVRVESIGKHFHIFNMSSVKQMILDKVSEGRNLWIACTTLRDAKDLKKRIEKRADELGDMNLKNGILLMSGSKQTSLQTKNDVLKEKKLTSHTVGKVWTGEFSIDIRKKEFPVKVFIFTPCITHGFSYDTEYFTDFFCIVNSNVDLAAREALQMCGRVRNAFNWIIGKMDTRERFDNMNSVEIAKSKLNKHETDSSKITAYSEYYGNDIEDLEAKLMFGAELEGKSYNADFIEKAVNHPQNSVYLTSFLIMLVTNLKNCKAISVGYNK